MAEKKPMTTREAIIDVLKRNGGEMSTKDVVKKVLPKAQNLKGKTAPHTVYTTMLSESKKEDGRVVQVKPGLYRYRAVAVAASEASVEVEPTPEAEKPSEDTAKAEKVAAVVVSEPDPVVEVTPDPKPKATRKRSTARTAVKRQVKA